HYVEVGVDGPTGEQGAVVQVEGLSVRAPRSDFANGAIVKGDNLGASITNGQRGNDASVYGKRPSIYGDGSTNPRWQFRARSKINGRRSVYQQPLEWACKPCTPIYYDRRCTIRLYDRAENTLGNIDPTQCAGDMYFGIVRSSYAYLRITEAVNF